MSSEEWVEVRVRSAENNTRKNVCLRLFRDSRIGSDGDLGVCLAMVLEDYARGHALAALADAVRSTDICEEELEEERAFVRAAAAYLDAIKARDEKERAALLGEK